VSVVVQYRCELLHLAMLSPCTLSAAVLFHPHHSQMPLQLQFHSIHLRSVPSRVELFAVHLTWPREVIVHSSMPVPPILVVFVAGPMHLISVHRLSSLQDVQSMSSTTLLARSLFHPIQFLPKQRLRIRLQSLPMTTFRHERGSHPESV
jgi:hypothetical protein